MGNAQASTTSEALHHARQHAVLDDEERAALLFLTAKDQPPHDIPKMVQILTNAGARSGVQLSSCPTPVHLATRNFCARLLRHQNPTCLRFLLDALVEQLRVVSGDVPSARGNQRAVLIQRTCNTLVLVRVLLTKLIAHPDQGVTLKQMLPSQDRDQLLRGLVRFCDTYGTSTTTKLKPTETASENKGSETRTRTTFVAQQMDYDVHLGVINLLLALSSTRLFHSSGHARCHPFRESLLSLTQGNKDIATSLVRATLEYFQLYEIVPTNSSYRTAMKELMN